MSGIDSTSDGRQRAWRWAAVFVLLVLFAVMPDKVIAVLSALAKVLIGLFVAKVAWDHGPELKSLIQAIVRG
ncbi:MAG: hypothetical protein HZB16_23930 [Armatimonadetes bacterium]|nr:hypothetical protein [Armatimonadota bacterium]